MKTFAYRTLEADTNTSLLACAGEIELEINPIENLSSSLEHQNVRVDGMMSIPLSYPLFIIILEKVASHNNAAIWALDIFKSGEEGPPNASRLRAGHDLLGFKQKKIYLVQKGILELRTSTFGKNGN